MAAGMAREQSAGVLCAVLVEEGSATDTELGFLGLLVMLIIHGVKGRKLVPCLRRRAEASSDALAPLRRAEGDSVVIREELSRLFKIEERHRRLLARLVLAFGLSILVYAAGAVLTWVFEGGQKGGDIKGFGDAAFFAAVQLLTVSSQIKNPLTVAGRIVDVGLEVWAIFVVTVVAGSFATFFSSGDSS
jgi:hypothetical protein